MSQSRLIAFLVFDGFEIIDHSGPASVFAAAGTVSDGGIRYDQVVFSVTGGIITANTGLEVSTRPVPTQQVPQIDTLFIVGANGAELKEALDRSDLIEGLKSLMPFAGRVASVCSGAFVLAATGALDGRQATTHWEGREHLAEAYPKVRVTKDDLYVADGKHWTAGGATAGVDMALAMLREDHGARLARDVAKRLLVYAHRPGYQSQFSALIDEQSTVGSHFSDLIGWLSNAPLARVNVCILAEKAGMSERTFYRRFTSEIGETPARYLEKIRMERAKVMLDSGVGVACVAEDVGYRSQSGFRAAFEGRFGVGPSVYRALQANDQT